jgi:gluconate kinase
MENNYSFLAAFLSKDSTQRAKWRITALSCFLSEDSAQTVKWRITAVSCFSQWKQYKDSQIENNPSFLSVFISEDNAQTAKWRVTAVSCLFFSVKAVHSQPNGE